MNGRSTTFYDDLADDYHLLFFDWDASVLGQGHLLHEMLSPATDPVLDVSCGINGYRRGIAHVQQENAQDSDDQKISEQRLCLDLERISARFAASP